MGLHRRLFQGERRRVPGRDLPERVSVIHFLPHPSPPPPLLQKNSPQVKRMGLIALTFPTTPSPKYSAKAIWDFEGIYCSSRHIPHVKFAGLIHPGILGCAPSAEVLAEWNRREGELIAASKLEDRNVALPPLPQSAHAGAAAESLAEKVGREGARTVPGRPEHGGNCE